MLAKRKVTHIYYAIVRGEQIYKNKTNLVKLENCIAKILTEKQWKPPPQAFSFWLGSLELNKKKHTY